MYEALQALDNITYVSVGHRPSLLRYHSKKLVLAGPGNPPHVEDIPLLDIDNHENDSSAMSGSGIGDSSKNSNSVTV
jgi:hypothetical protein